MSESEAGCVGMESESAAILEPSETSPEMESKADFPTSNDEVTEERQRAMSNYGAKFVDAHNNNHHGENQEDEPPIELRHKPKLSQIGRSVSTFSSLRMQSEGNSSSTGTGRPRTRSVLEEKEFAYTKLKDELHIAQLELKMKDQENEKLVKMENELEELTASLFEEANKMVQDANLKRMHAEKLLVEANSKIEVLMAEVSALKTLVITSTPSMPNRHLHPQLDNDESPKFVKGHRRSTSHHDVPKQVMPTSLSLPLNPPPVEPKNEDVDPIMFKEFQTWRQQPELQARSPFLQRIYQEDIAPCMNFHNEELSSSVFDSIRNNLLTIEIITGKRGFPNCCALLNTQRVCQYRVRLSDNTNWYYVSELARNRIAAVCDFYTYVRYIHQGLVKSDDPTVYWEVIRLRKRMTLARLGLHDNNTV